jgi:hypothetical protein
MSLVVTYKFELFLIFVNSSLYQAQLSLAQASKSPSFFLFEVKNKIIKFNLSHQ